MFLTFSLMSKFADLLDYPDESLKPKAIALAESVKWYAEIWEDLIEAFALHLQLTPMAEVEETYTRTFDMNPSASLEIGWHLFGETYKRGAFLSNLRPRLREFGIKEGSNLPDHLATLLRLLGKLPHEEALGLTRDCILPALEKLRPKVESAAPYGYLMEALELMLKMLAPAAEGPTHQGCECGGKDHSHAHAHDHGGFRGPEVDHAR